MPKIEFKQFVRDCPANTAMVDNGRPSRNLIRDFTVLIDGEHRVTLTRIRYGGKGYEVRDPNHFPIQRAWGPYDRVEEIAAQAQFLPTLHNLLACGHIPTLAEIEMTKLRADAEAEDRKRTELLGDIKHTKERAAEQMYDVISRIMKSGLDLTLILGDDTADMLYKAHAAANDVPKREED